MTKPAESIHEIKTEKQFLELKIYGITVKTYLSITSRTAKRQTFEVKVFFFKSYQTAIEQKLIDRSCKEIKSPIKRVNTTRIL